MKKSGLSIFERLIYIINILFAILLICVYVLPFIPPKFSSTLSILNLGLPPLIIINLIFIIFWLVKLKKQMILSIIAILCGFLYFDSIYKFGSNTLMDEEGSLDIMSYNVRLFDKYNWTGEKEITSKIKKFIELKNPDIVTFQDYYISDTTKLEGYEYNYIVPSKKKGKHGLAIFSKKEIINRKNLRFENTSNNGIYVDILHGKDTIRLFGIHLESLKIDPDVRELQSENQKKLISRIGKSFVKQQSQAEIIANEIANSPHPVVVSADLNNSPVSYVSKSIMSDRLQDNFSKAGNGFGRTFVFDFIPIRIDVIFSDLQFKVIDFHTYDVKYSDHYPIQSKIKLKD
ncbi:MAG: endonuclease/exonuclease/phosphatase family protein [Psychroflexus halocasei]|uniref:endonuclease/exonuclease/phosphatase family protein n=1 Tax=Psychroflexus sp. S27 TaxID=1982757 RepID=UPI000C2B18A4|nr:endonuclease/exonuclease/phosphatase family protein [Psychroflexus sp. S27]PJX24521.1 hypothetical protein CAP47_03270 [Psychroflexus sp. S27]